MIGIKVGSKVEDLKDFSNKLSLAGWFKVDKNEIKNDGVYSWFKKEDNNYTKGINIKVEQGKVSSIELANLETEY